MRAREQVIRDVTTGDLTQRVGIGAVERHRAVAYSDNPLSMAIDRLRAEHRPKDEKRQSEQEDFRFTTGREVVELLLEFAVRSYPDEMDAIGSTWDRRKLAVMALMERTVRRCDTCRGRREVQVPEQPSIICPACSGSGRAYKPSAEIRNTAFGRKMGRKENQMMRCLLSAWDHNEHGTAGAVAAMYDEVI